MPEPLTYRAIARELAITEREVRRIEREALDKLRRFALDAGWQPEHVEFDRPLPADFFVPFRGI